VAETPTGGFVSHLLVNPLIGKGDRSIAARAQASLAGRR
jgi:hypothetical protein